MTRKVIDAHVHLFQEGFLPSRWFEGIAERWAGSAWPHRDPSTLDVEGGLVDPGGKLLFQEMEASGVDGVVCLNLDWGVSLGDAPLSPREVHEYYADLQRSNPGKFTAVAAVDPRRDDAVETIRLAVDGGGLSGVKLYPPTGYYADDAICDPVYEICRELDVPVVIHTAFIGYPHHGHFANPSHIASAQSKFPDLSFVLAHSGHHFWLDEALAVAAGHPNTYLDMSNWNEMLHDDVEGLTHVVERMRKEVGAHKMIFASDHLGGRRFSGKGNITRYLDFVTNLPSRSNGSISEEEIDLILGENAVRVFRINIEAAEDAKAGAGR